MFNTAILLIVYNRPTHTKAVFDKIRAIKPKQLFVAADGPNKNKPNDIESTQKVREIASNVDWDCDIQTLFRKENSGCKKGVSSAINWFFEHVEQGIILEDDTVPDLSFFKFCDYCLTKYKDNENIAHISGYTPFNTVDITHSYFFHQIPSIWGWATWRRAWEKYDVTIKTWETIKPIKDYQMCMLNQAEYERWAYNFDQITLHDKDTWDYQWHFCVWSHHWLCISPKVNLIENIGFGEEATHTKKKKSFHAINRSQSLEFPLNDPALILPNVTLDQDYVDKFIPKVTLKTKVIKCIKWLLSPKKK